MQHCVHWRLHLGNVFCSAQEVATVDAWGRHSCVYLISTADCAAAPALCVFVVEGEDWPEADQANT